MQRHETSGIRSGVEIIKASVTVVRNDGGIGHLRLVVKHVNQ